MKTHYSLLTLLSLLTALLSSSVSANSPDKQNSAGKVTYKQVTNMHTLLGPSQQAMKALIPKEKNSLIELTFAADSYRLSSQSLDKGKVSTVGLGQESSTIVNTDLSMLTRFGEMAGFPYQVKQPIATLHDIQLHPETKMIDQFEVKRLTGTANINNKQQNVEIWYSSEFSTYFSPYPLAGLPGAVLSMTVGTDYLKYEINSISFEIPTDSEFVVPAKHQEITNEQLQDLREEAIDALRSSGANVMSNKR